MGCTQQLGPAVTEASGPQGHQCQAGREICASHSREREEGLDNSQCHGVSSSNANGEGKAQTCSTPGGTRPVSGAAGTHGIRGGDDPVFPGPDCILMLLRAPENKTSYGPCEG